MPAEEMKYTGRFKKLAEQFRADGCDEAMIERFIREEMEREEWEKGQGTTGLDAYREWKAWPESRRQMYLDSAFCPVCGVASFAPGYVIRKDRFCLIIEGTCRACGSSIARCCD